MTFFMLNIGDGSEEKAKKKKKEGKKVKLQFTRRGKIVKEKKKGIQADRYIESWKYKRENNYIMFLIMMLIKH